VRNGFCKQIFNLFIAIKMREVIYIKRGFIDIGDEFVL